MLELGLKPAPGWYSYGWPPIPKFDGIDGWAASVPLFELLNEANADGVIRAGFQTHEYARWDMMSSIDHYVSRYEHMPYDGPVFLGEFGYAIGYREPSTEQVLKDIGEICTHFATDPRLVGFAWYDLRGIATDKWDYMFSDMLRYLQEQHNKQEDPWQILPITIPPGGIIPAPPDPDPPLPEEPSLAGVTVKHPGCNMRRSHTKDSDWLGYAAQGSEFNVEFPAVNEYNYIPDLDCWIWGNNIYIA
jgi:hypothetical protein